jgi:gamma-glutamyltranspeptidase/glutathione hydrolase
MPEMGPLSITVPGTVDGWTTLLERHGTLSLSEVLQPAIEYAERGFPVSQIIAAKWQELEELLQGTPFLINHHAPHAGEVFRNSELAHTLRAIAEGGRDAFYHGPLAEMIAQHVQALGGFLSIDDLAQHTSTWDEPISTEYHGVKVVECPPNGQGIVALLALNILEGVDLASLGYGSTAYYHHILEALKLAFADGLAHIADPRQVKVPIETMLDKRYAATRRAQITDRAALHSVSGSARRHVYLP